MVLYCFMLNFLARFFINVLRKLDPWSVKRALGGPYMQIKFLTNESAIETDVASLKGIATEYLVNKSCIVSMYVCVSLSSGRERT